MTGHSKSTKERKLNGKLWAPMCCEGKLVSRSSIEGNTRDTSQGVYELEKMWGCDLTRRAKIILWKILISDLFTLERLLRWAMVVEPAQSVQGSLRHVPIGNDQFRALERF